MLKFGTSGLRGLVKDMTDKECFVNTLGFITYLLEQRIIEQGSSVIIGGDLRPSTPTILLAVAAAIKQARCKVIYAGLCPTPALLAYGLTKGNANIMVTGSHIPEDRNGIKFCKPNGEVLKDDEPTILAAVAKVREQVQGAPYDTWFTKEGKFVKALEVLPPITVEIMTNYRQRYLSFFPKQALKGLRIVVDQHSAVGRDLLPELLSDLGADVIIDGRTDYFVAIDTENVTPEAQARFKVFAQKYHPNAIVSTDGDSDRPFILDGLGNFFRGDLVGAVVANYLNADFAALPISSNDVIDHYLKQNQIPYQKTKIGSPYVIDAMNSAVDKGKKSVVGWEVNGGFMVNSICQLDGRELQPLPTRDAMLPILILLYLAAPQKNLNHLFEGLTNRATQAGLLDNFPVDISKKLITMLSPDDKEIKEVRFNKQKTELVTDKGNKAIETENGKEMPSAKCFWQTKQLSHFDIKTGLETFYFKKASGFNEISTINYIDGVRIQFENYEIVHIRPSGNAPQLRLYTNCDTQERADALVELGLKPDGILRQIEKDILTI